MRLLEEKLVKRFRQLVLKLKIMSKILQHFKRKQRQRRIRKKIKGTKNCPRLSVFRSNKYIYCQLVDDDKGVTLLSADDRKLKDSKKKLTKKETAFEVGKKIAEKALAKKIEQIVFDRGGYRYHGRVKAVADGAREGGLKF
jgi:large subunit ribosomal protein L18